MGTPIVITKEGLQKLENELENLVTVRRKEITESIKQARDYGDLSENSEYDDAMNEQAVVEARITQLENMIKTAVVVEEDSVDSSVIGIGSKVKLLDKEYNEKVIYQIVGPTEANPAQQKISYQSPLGVALVGRSKGEEVTVEAPAGNLIFKILSIEK